MNASDSILRTLLTQAAKKGLTPQQLADAADIPYSAAHKLLNRQSRRPTLDTVFALAAALGLHFEVRDSRGHLLDTPKRPDA